MELQQQQQQLISMEGIENSNFRALLTKLINVMLSLLAVILIVLSTVASMLGPFLTTRYVPINISVNISNILSPCNFVRSNIQQCNNEAYFCPTHLILYWNIAILAAQVWLRGLQLEASLPYGYVFHYIATILVIKHFIEYCNIKIAHLWQKIKTFADF